RRSRRTPYDKDRRTGGPVDDTGQAADATRQKGLLLRRSLVIGAGAVVIELTYWASLLRHYQPQRDANQYFVMAGNFAAGRGVADSFLQPYVHATAFRPPLYPVLLGSLFHVFGVHLVVAQAANVLLGALVVVLAERLTTKIAGPAAGLRAAIAVGLCPSLLANDAVPLSEPLGLVLFLLALLFLADRLWIPAGVTVGLFLLTRPTGPALLVAACVWLAVHAGWRNSLRLLFAAAVVAAPWMARNEVRLHSPSIVTSNGFNLSAMYSPEAIARGGFVDPATDPTFWWLRPSQIGEGPWDQTLVRRGLGGVVSHPVAVVETVASNLGHLSELLPNDPIDRGDGRNIRFRTATLPVFYMTAVLGLLGLWRFRRDPRARLLLLLAAAVVLPSALTVVAPRLRATMDLTLAIGAALLLTPARMLVWGSSSAGASGRVLCVAALQEWAAQQEWGVDDRDRAAAISHQVHAGGDADRRLGRAHRPWQRPGCSPTGSPTSTAPAGRS
ncbi:MAG: glycosyltransferase family 39 protein, partial [Actinomycetota bacterium]|nr:glycosyltransferase family 39 protein [Actinomycetota bacterium]